VTQEINSVVLKLVLLENISHGLLLDVNVLPGLWVIEVNILDIYIEIAASLLFEESH
jgi:hypothetical protein